jgi:Domain of unknown function (DUF6429)
LPLTLPLRGPRARGEGRGGGLAEIGAMMRDSPTTVVLVMEINTDRIDEAVLALLLLGRHDGDRVWKSFDWDAMDRLHRKGMISDPVGKAKSVVLTEAGEREAERLFREMFEARQ